MKIEELKMIPISQILSHLGYQPVSRMGGGSHLMYHSPLRQDANASFSVSTRKNLWMDFGTSRGGNVIDLVIALKGGCSFSEAVSWLEEFAGGSSVESVLRFPNDGDSNQTGNSNICNTRVEELTSPALLMYLESRGIPAEIGQRYCKEAHYTVRDREYYSIAFLNILGGMELRNKYFKGCHGVKAVSIDRVEKTMRTPTCCLFEGFMDFLSYRVLEENGDCELVPRRPCDCIILNSTSITLKAVPFIDVYRCTYSFLDNDYAGRQSTAALERSMPGRIHDMSNKFAPFNDLNEYLVQMFHELPP